MYIWINTQKISLFDGFVLEIWLIKKSCNLTGWEQSGPYLRKQNFPKYGICGRTKHELLGHSLFIIEQIKWKSIARFFNKFKKPCFWPIFGPFPQFGRQKTFFQTSYGFLAPCQNLEKENAQTDGRMEGRTAFKKLTLNKFCILL